MFYSILGMLYFLLSAWFAIAEKEKRKLDDGSYEPVGLIGIILAIGFFAPYAAGIWIGLDTMGLISFLPPFAMWAITEYIFVNLGI